MTTHAQAGIDVGLDGTIFPVPLAAEAVEHLGQRHRHGGSLAHGPHHPLLGIPAVDQPVHCVPEVRFERLVDHRQPEKKTILAGRFADVFQFDVRQMRGDHNADVGVEFADKPHGLEATAVVIQLLETHVDDAKRMTVTAFHHLPEHFLELRKVTERVRHQRMVTRGAVLRQKRAEFLRIVVEDLPIKSETFRVVIDHQNGVFVGHKREEIQHY